MKLRILLLALLTALLATSVAYAKGGPPAGKGKPETTGVNCKPKVKVALRGTLASDPAAGDTSLLLTVTKSNRHGRAYVSAAQPVEILVDASTKVRRKGPDGPTKTLESLAMSDGAKIRAKACKAELRNGGMPQLTARKIIARPAAPAP
jgi:hypothetical protein